MSAPVKMIVWKKGDRGKMVGGWQRDLQAMGYYLGFRVDDDFGKETDRATREFQADAGLVVDGEVGDATRAAAKRMANTECVSEQKGTKEAKDTVGMRNAVSLGERIAIAAQGELWVREISKNRGDGIAKYWEATSYAEGYRNREPYCAAFVCWCAREAGVVTRPTDAAVRFLVAWALRNPTRAIVFDHPTSYVPSAGDLVYFRFGGGSPNHIGVVIDYDGKYVFTVEANTDGTGGREGDGVYRRTRPLSLCKGFIRLGVGQ